MIAIAPPAPLTFRDYLHFPEDGLRHELIGGEHFVSAAPSRKHQIVLGNLFLILAGFVRKRRLGLVLLSPFDLVLSLGDVVQPDLLFVSRQRLGILGEAMGHGAPDLVVEILSPSSRRKDAVLKRALYEQVGVAEYWIVDPDRETVEVFAATPAGLERVSERTVRDRLSTPLLRGLSFPVSALFEMEPPLAAAPAERGRPRRGAGRSRSRRGLPGG